ncbi:MAG: hypothetical protein GC162_07330 [Planctomycetes bacterium]|nr:hypothetical protein [Planctomycetota bacterium]
MQPYDLPDTLRDFFATVSTLSLATVDDAHKPHAANLNFVADADVNLYWVSHPDSAHSRHLSARPDAAISTYADFTAPSEIRGLQMHGRVEPIDPADFDRVLALFLDRFPYAVQLVDRIRREQFYVLRPTWVRWIDNSINFGFKIETHWPRI